MTQLEGAGGQRGFSSHWACLPTTPRGALPGQALPLCAEAQGAPRGSLFSAFHLLLFCHSLILQVQSDLLYTDTHLKPPLDDLHPLFCGAQWAPSTAVHMNHRDGFNSDPPSDVSLLFKVLLKYGAVPAA